MSHVYCPECGFQNPESSNYCSKCGALLAREDSGEARMAFTPEEVDVERLTQILTGKAAPEA